MDEIVVVSGLPRSGTSMMMKMLEAGGVPPLTDHLRTADEDNPKGYYEFERVKMLETDKAWVPQARGKAVKVISTLLPHLPPEFAYRLVFMRRNIDEVLASQRRMLENRGTAKSGGPDEAKMRDILIRHLSQILSWLKSKSWIELLEVSYNDLLERPADVVPRIDEHLGGGLDTQAMVDVVDRRLYRQRR